MTEKVEIGMNSRPGRLLEGKGQSLSGRTKIVALIFILTSCPFLALEIYFLKDRLAARSFLSLKTRGKIKEQMKGRARG